MKKKILLIPLALLLAMSLVATGCPAPAPPEVGEKPTYHFKYAATGPPKDEHVIAVMSFAERILEASDGRIVIDVHHSGILGDWIPVTGEVMKGTIEMASGWQPSVYDPRMDVMVLPYLLLSFQEVIEVKGTGGGIYEIFAKMGRDLGYEIVGVFPAGFGGIGTTKPIPSPTDLDVDKGLKIRIWAAKAPELTVKYLGFMPTVIPLVDVYSSLEVGVVDGVYGSDARGAYHYYRDVISYWYDYRAFQYNTWSIINLDLWNTLSAEDQKIIMDSGLEMERTQSLRVEEEKEEYEQKMRDYGIEVIIFTDEEYAKLAAGALEEVWPELEPMLGKKLIDDAAAIVEAIR